MRFGVGLHGRPRHSGGFSLIELMISLTLGLLIIAAASATYLSGKKTFAQNTGMARVQENMRTSLQIIDTAVRQAGFISYVDNGELGLPAPVFSDGSTQYSFVYAQAYSVASPATAYSFVDPHSEFVYPSTAAAGLSALGDKQLDYLAVAYGGVSAAAGRGEVTDCLGSPIASNEVALNVFFVARKSADKVFSLYCAARHYPIVFTGGAPQIDVSSPSSTHSAQPVAQGVTNLAVGVDVVAADGSHTYYNTPDSVPAGAWSQVRALRLTLNVESPETIAVGRAADAGNIAGGYLQQQVVQTVALRN
jgi:prepilin-type N-terminal cleavage/methylation domain-containing protein